MQLSSSELLRLQPFLVAASTWRLTSLALSNSVLLFFELSAIHVLGCVGGPRSIWALVLVWVSSVTGLHLVGRPALLFVRDALFSFILFFIVPAARLRRCSLLVIEI